MGFREIKAGLKAEAVFTVLAGSSIVNTSTQYEVDVDSLSEWVRRVKEEAEKWLAPYKRGPKQKKPDPNLKKIEKLNQLLDRNQAKINQLEESLREIKEAQREKEPRPAKCDRCGCEKAYKNGKYLIKPKRFFDLLKRSEQPILVPQFVCASCGHSLYLDKHKVLFFPGQDKQRD